MQDFFDLKGPLAELLERYEPRDGQVVMAEAVSRVISGEGDSPSVGAKILVVEAETGIGKTLAYLVPSILSGKRMVISTATLNLQDQIMKKEIPLVSEALGEAVSAMCIKGRQNYLCRYRWFQYRSSPQVSLLEDNPLEKIDSWLDTTHTGDRAELEWLSERSSLWPKISAHSNQCLGGECPESSLCFINQLRRKAGSARVLVVNHHLFFSDLALRQGGFGEILPRYEGVIFDEAHHLENVATTFFGRTFSQYQLLDLLADIERQAEADLDPGRQDRVLGILRGLKQRTEEFAALFPEERGRYHLDGFVTELSAEVWRNEVEFLSTGLERLREYLAECSPYGEGWHTLEKRAQELNTNLLDIALAPIDTGKGLLVHWYERRERSITLSATPVQVADQLRTTLYSAVSCCIMTSATLSSGGNFAYMKERLGLDDTVEFLRLASPFDYKNRTLLYIPENSFPEPSAREYSSQVCERVLDILQLSRGRALVLFTSFKGMDSMAEYLHDHLAYPVLVQGRGSRHGLLQSFRENTDSVLLAVASFWEGVDVPGEALSCVIIDKLPFEVPSDPVIQARIQSINESGGRAFFDFQVPRAILTLRQGVGRLMRAAGDRGVIAILDVRLFNKGYGRTFLKSLPPSPVVRNLDAVAEFYQDGIES